LVQTDFNQVQLYLVIIDTLPILIVAIAIGVMLHVAHLYGNLSFQILSLLLQFWTCVTVQAKVLDHEEEVKQSG